MIGVLYGKRQIDGSPAVETSQYLKTLRALLEVYPEQNRAEALALVSNNDDSFTASILSSLTPPVPTGLAPVAHAIMIAGPINRETMILPCDFIMHYQAMAFLRRLHTYISHARS